MLQFAGHPITAAGWSNLKIGAGGLINAFDIHSDGTLVCRADVFGAYVYNRAAANPGNAGGTGVWQQLCTTTSLASQSALIQTPLMGGDGVYEIRIAPSNSSIFYMAYIGYVWLSSNKGATWARMAFAHDVAIGGNISTPRLSKYKMAIDPINPDVVYIVTPTAGAQVTTTGTSTGSWSAVSVVANNDSNKIGLVAFDPSSGSTSGQTNVCYISVSGTGLYKRATPAGSFALVTSTPTQIVDLQVASNGTVYCITNAGVLWQLVGTTWTNISPSFVVAQISIHPTTPTTLHAWSYNNGGMISTNSGGAWVGIINNPVTMTATDTPWLATLLDQFFTAGMGCSLYDTLDTTKIWCSVEQGMWQISLPIPTTNVAAVFNSFSSGLEEIVIQDICVPPGGFPLICGQDVGILQQSDITKYVTTQAWPLTSFLSFGAGADYASNDSTFVAGITDFQSAELSGKSSSSGAPGTWTAFTGFPASGGAGGGSIACATSSEMIWIQAVGGGPFHTANGGGAWASISGLPTDGWYSFLPVLTRRTVAADRVTIGTFYLQNSGPTAPGTYVVSNNGATVVYHANSIDLGFNSVLRAVPGNAGHLFFTSGPQGGAGDPASAFPHNQLFYYSTNGGGTWTDVSSLSSGAFTIREVWSFGFGKAKTGQTYPAIYIYGFVVAGGSAPPSGSTPAVWVSYDQGLTWTQIGNQFPIGWVDVIRVVNGDMNIFGRVYLGCQGSSCQILQ